MVQALREDIMKVKEIIELLQKCNQEYEVRNCDEYLIDQVIERTNFSDESDCMVILY